MADPLSVAGLVTGAISLCLQLTGGLIDYLDAVKGRTEDLSSAKRKATQTSSLLLAIRDLYPQLKTSWPASATLVDKHVKSCETELSALHAYLSELSQHPSSGSGLRFKFHEKQKMLTYPFNRSHITRLEERLASVNSTLQVAELCEFSSYEDETWTTDYTVTYNGLRRLFQKAFAISLVSSVGAGGRSISPIFTYYPTIDRKTAPAFRILTLAEEMIDYSDNQDDQMKALKLCFQSVFILYNQRRASPKDLDMYGQSLMHLAVSIFSDNPIRSSVAGDEIGTDGHCGTCKASPSNGPKPMQRYPECVQEENAYGMTALFFAIKHPPCLRLILEAEGTSLLTCKYYRWPPLYFAVYFGYKTSLQLLLEAGCPIYFESLYDSYDSCIDDLILSTLRQRRDELKELALNNLTEAEAKSFGLYENKVLDGHALGVLELIRSRGVTIPSHLQAESFTPVYMQYAHNDTLDKMWALGFRDVDHCDSFGQMPLMGTALSYSGMRWLIDHGADYWTPFNERSDSTVIKIPVTPAHFLFYGVIREYAFFDGNDDMAGGYTDEQWVVEKLMHVRAYDTCSCLCSQAGCTPLKAFLDGLCSRPFSSSLPEDLAKIWIQSLEIFQNKLNENDLMLVLRRLTFEALQITHTCCNFNRDYNRDYPSRYSDSLHTMEEVDEINSEQSFLLATFADLLEELVQIAHEDRGGTHLIVHNPEEFWIHRWLPLVTKTLEELDGDDLTAEERSAGEAIGVVWGPTPPPTAPALSKWKPPTPKEVMEAVKKIMNE
ncbi:hypothetical protein NPX13_g5471 [Xylaria arbuscula]|uniref:Fungal N-terminal domain-containing protein n=1 Tax=Xylaria arbuscula TaxID=114810 RepID=A0A9W8NES0_9PEZI|nr:hypothetical protein NPX13_g5471 [Xylaria arbuscula]